MARVALAEQDRLIEREAAVEMRDEMRRAMGAHGGERGIEPPVPQGRHFFERARFDHAPETVVDPRIEHSPLGREKEGGTGLRVEQRRAARPLKGDERPSGGGENLQRAKNPLRIRGAQSGRRLRVERGEFGVQRLRALPLRGGAHPRAHLFGNGGNVGKPVERRLEIHAGAADDDRRRAVALEFGERRRQIGEVTADRIIYRGVDMAEKAVRRETLLLWRRPRRQDAKVAIDLHGVGVDDRAADATGKFERQRRLAGGGGTCNENGARGHGAIGAYAGRMSKAGNFVATFVAGQGETLSDAMVARALAAAGLAGPLDWLAPAQAADVRFEGGELAAHRARLKAALEGESVDVVVQPEASRRKRLLVADMDSTMIQQECIDELAALIGIRERIAAITERAMQGEIDFAAALEERVALLAGVRLEDIDALAAELTPTPGARALVRTMRANGARTALVSGGFTQFTRSIAARLGFHETRANTLEIEAGALTGRVRPPIQGRESKRAALVELRDAEGLPPEATLAIGDGANDLDMLREAGLGVAYRAKPKVAAAAHARIDHADLTALLYAQGYRAQDVVT